MQKISGNQAGIAFIPVMILVLVIGVVGTLAFSRVKQAQLNEQRAAADKTLQESLAKSQKELAFKAEQQKDAAKESAPEPVENLKPVPTTKTPTSDTQKTTTKTPTKTEQPKKDSPAPTGTLSLASAGGKNVSWSTNGSALYGYKLVWSSSPSPVYPTNNPTFYDAKATSGSVNASSGTYYVRVCMYHNSSCMNYSNEVTVTIP